MTILKIAGVLLIVLVISFFVLGRTSSEVHIERVLNAPLTKVWAVWTDPEAMRSWWSPKDFTAPVIESDFRQDGKFLYSMRSAKGEMYWNAGHYTEIVPMQRIRQLMSFADKNGAIVPGKDVPMPGVWPDAIDVLVEFREVEGKTHIAVTEIGIPMIMKLFAKMGWEQQMDKLEKLVN